MAAIQPVRSARVNLREQTRRYRAMVRAVRAWVRIAHPSEDRICVVAEDVSGCGDIIAAFHSWPEKADEFTRGDWLAGSHRI